LTISHLHKIFRKKLPVICKNKKNGGTKILLSTCKIKISPQKLI